MLTWARCTERAFAGTRQVALMRIVAGKARGHPLLGPRSANIRPTADRVREAVFNILGQWMDGWSVLDLFAGTGALSLEAISRGARRAVMVDQNKEAVRLCRTNAAALGFQDQVEILALPVDRALAQLQRAGEQFELIFADPPYAFRAGQQLLEAIASARLLAGQGILCLEHNKRESAPEHPELSRTGQRRFGDTVVSIYRVP